MPPMSREVVTLLLLYCLADFIFKLNQTANSNFALGWQLSGVQGLVFIKGVPI